MTRSSYTPNLRRLPDTIPIFPLSGVLLLPGGQLPLNIFEPRYLAMTEDALRSADRLIGMTQPIECATDDAVPPVFSTGCAGRVTAFEETDDGRYLITLTGVCRFDITEELATSRGYRRIQADWTGFESDLVYDDDESGNIDRDQFITALKAFFQLHSLKADWDAISQAPDARLVTTLAMVCPFAPSEKQALLEAPNLVERARVMVALMQMALAEEGPGHGLRH